LNIATVIRVREGEASVYSIFVTLRMFHEFFRYSRLYLTSNA